jgi:hypothetical protein
MLTDELKLLIKAGLLEGSPGGGVGLAILLLYTPVNHLLFLRATYGGSGIRKRYKCAKK